MEAQGSISLSDFESLFKENYASLCKFALNYLKDPDAAEEVVQSLFVKIWEKRAEVEVQYSQRAYLFSAVRNACINQLKHIKVREAYKEVNERERAEEGFASHDTYQVTELADKIQTVINEMPAGRREVFCLSRYEGLKYKEIADRLKISVKTVEHQMGSALKQLRGELAEFLVLFIIYLWYN